MFPMTLSNMFFDYFHNLGLCEDIRCAFAVVKATVCVDVKLDLEQSVLLVLQDSNVVEIGIFQNFSCWETKERVELQAGAKNSFEIWTYMGQLFEYVFLLIWLNRLYILKDIFAVDEAQVLKLLNTQIIECHMQLVPLVILLITWRKRIRGRTLKEHKSTRFLFYRDSLAQLEETTTKRPDVNGLVVAVLHQLYLWSSVPPGLDVTWHASLPLFSCFLSLL
jgi:hypothetical protein